jgi:hypothetical protein
MKKKTLINRNEQFLAALAAEQSGGPMPPSLYPVPPHHSPERHEYRRKHWRVPSDRPVGRPRVSAAQ